MDSAVALVQAYLVGWCTSNVVDVKGGRKRGS
jgi:hypothetical protein